MARVSIYLLGSFQVRVEDQWITRKFRTDKERALLAYLAIEGDRPISRETLAELFWPERYEGVGRTNLRQALLGVRKAIGDVDAAQPLLIVNDVSIQLNRQASFWFDTSAFSARFQASYDHQHQSMTTCPVCAQGLQEAVDLYRQDFLDGLNVDESPTYQEWVIFHREQYQRYLLDILDHLGEFYKKLGELDEAQKYAWLHVKRAPLEERAYRRLMELLALSGRRSAALEQYQNCQRILERELSVEPSPETITLFHKIRDGQPIAADEESEIPPLRGLPRPMTDFFGREAELERLEKCFLNPNCHLVSISGMPGVGKSRLAIEAANRYAHLFPDSVYYVSLLGLQACDLCLHALARALGLTIHTNNPKIQILRTLSTMRCLLIIDQFDGAHQCTDLMMEILNNAPNLKLVIVSHQRINLQAANQVRLEGLPYPQDPHDKQSLQSPSLKLLLNRAQHSRPGFPIDQEILTYLVDICQRVEGVPLALELAADRLRELSMADIAAHLHQGLSVLSTSLQDIPERHRSLEKSLQFSLQMLDEPIQKLFVALSIFSESFTPAAAQAICQAKPEDLATLSEHSFLQGMMRSRYAMNPLLRQFALLLLDQQKDEKQALQASYGEYFLSYLHQKAAQLNLKDPDRTCLNDIDKELTHLNLALDWAMLTGQRQLAIQGARDLERFRQAYQVVLLNNSTKIANLPEFDNVDLDSEHLRMVEQSGFCCDRQRHLSDANNAILIAAESGQITAANFQAQQLSGYALEALLEKNIDELGLNSHDIDWVDSPQIETHLIHRSGASVAVDALRSSSRQAQTFSYMFILRKRENYNKQENTVILEDPLTHLPNRQAFIDQLRKSISQAANRAQQVGVLIIDIHGYKSILEQMGLENSQFLLKRVAERLQESLRQADFLARLGADEFGLILENLPQSKVVQVVAGKLLAQFEQPFNVGEKPLQLSVSIGTGLYPLDGDHAEALMRFADQASKKSE